MSMVSIKYQDASTGSIVDSSVQKITSGASHVADQAVHPGEDATLDRTWGGPKGSKATSISNGNVKASAGVVYGFEATTGGDFELKDGATLWGRWSLSTTGLMRVVFPCAVIHTTNITASASSAVVTVFYT